MAKRVTLGIFVLFLLLFPRYAPWEPNYAQSNTLTQKIFTLYFFIANQTLGVDAMHDFHYMLSAMGLLAYETLIAGLTRFVAYLIMIAAVIGMFFDAFSNKDKKRMVKKIWRRKDF